MGWTTGGRFSRPVDFLGAQQRQALANWFGYVRNGVLTANDLNSQTTAGHLAQVLDEFTTDLIGGRPGTPTLSDRARVQNLPSNPVSLSLLGRPAKGGDSVSQATLELGDRKRTPLPGTPVNKPVILVDPEMPSKLGISAADISLFQSATLESIGFDPVQLERQYGSEIRVITPNQIFLDELYLLPGEQALMNSWLPRRLEGTPTVNGERVTPLLPFRPEIRHLFSSKELEERCELRLIQSGVASELEVRISMPLQGQREPPLPGKLTPLHPDHFHHQGA